MEIARIKEKNSLHTFKDSTGEKPNKQLSTYLKEIEQELLTGSF